MPESGRDIERIREGIEDLKVALALHDNRAAGYVDKIIETQDRIGQAIDKIGEATVAIRALAQQVEKRGNGNGGGRITLDRRTLLWLFGIALAGALAMGGGQEAAHRLLQAWIGGSSP